MNDKLIMKEIGLSERSIDNVKRRFAKNDTIDHNIEDDVEIILEEAKGVNKIAMSTWNNYLIYIYIAR